MWSSLFQGCMLFAVVQALITFTPDGDVPQTASQAPPYAGTIDMPIDHFNASDNRTYKNRYWMNDTYFQEGGPVFLYDFGEAGPSELEIVGVLGEAWEFFAVVELARRYHGIALIWEHRFYGQSLPFEVNVTTGKPLAEYGAYKYLTNEQALEDVVYFATHFDPPGHNESLTSNSTPWIFVGGSYAGVRAAMIRQRNPDVFLASWAASAPVHSVPFSSTYFNPIQQAMPTNCSADVHAAITYADNVLTSGSQVEVDFIREALSITMAANPEYSNLSPIDPSNLSYWQLGLILSYPFQDSFVSFQSFGFDLALRSFCDQIQMWNLSDFLVNGLSLSSALIHNSEDCSPTVAGVAATYGGETAFYAYLHATIQKSIADYIFYVAYVASHGVSGSAVDDNSWLWQVCSQFGEMQVSGSSGSTNIVSSFLNASATEAIDCQASFSYAPPSPDVNAFLKYGDWRMKPSNVMFTNGAKDPWRALGVQATTNINPDALNRPSTTQVPQCNTPPAGYEVFGLVYPNAVHGQDMTKSLTVPANVTLTSGTPMDSGLALFSEALDTWLPCWQPS